MANQQANPKPKKKKQEKETDTQRQKVVEGIRARGDIPIQQGGAIPAKTQLPTYDLRTQTYTDKFGNKFSYPPDKVPFGASYINPFSAGSTGKLPTSELSSTPLVDKTLVTSEVFNESGQATEEVKQGELRGIKAQIQGIEETKKGTQTDEAIAAPDYQKMQSEENKAKYEGAAKEIKAKASASMLRYSPLPEEYNVGYQQTKYSFGQTFSLKGLAEVWDVARYGMTRKKPLKYESAKELLDYTNEVLKTELDNIMLGGDTSNTLLNFERSVMAINRMEQATKGLGKLNMNWFIDDGVSISSEIEAEKATLENMRMRINQAIAEQQLQQRRAAIIQAGAANK